MIPKNLVVVVTDSATEYRHLYALGIDGLFTDFSDTAFKAREAMANGVWPAIEYRLAGTTRYFRTNSQAEPALVAANGVGAWELTGHRQAYRPRWWR